VSDPILIEHNCNIVCVQVKNMISQKCLTDMYSCYYVYKNNLHNYYFQINNTCNIVLNNNTIIESKDSIHIRMIFIEWTGELYIDDVMKYLKIKNYFRYQTARINKKSIFINNNNVTLCLYYGNKSYYLDFVSRSQFLLYRQCDIIIDTNITLSCNIYQTITTKKTIMYKIEFITLYMFGNIITFEYTKLFEHLKHLIILNKIYAINNILHFPNNIIEQLELDKNIKSEESYYTYITCKSE